MGGSKSKPVGNIVCIGLDHAGKSTIINYLKADKDKAIELAPTVGFQSERFKFNGSLFTCFDMSGAKQYRALWRENLDNCEGVIFVVDSSDILRLCVAENELSEVIGLIPQSVPILFLANKSDHAQSASTDVIVDRLRIQEYCKLHKWHVAATDGLRGTGVNDAVEWLTSAMPVKKKKK